MYVLVDVVPAKLHGGKVFANNDADAPRGVHRARGIHQN